MTQLNSRTLTPDKTRTPGAHLEGGHRLEVCNSTGGLRSHKRSMYEGGVRSPSLARWPGRVPAGTVAATPWAFWDVLPTLADAAGVPEAVPRGLDGVSFLPLLLRGDVPGPPGEPAEER